MKTKVFLLTLYVFIFIPEAFAAPVTVGPATIYTLRTGWDNDSFSITLSGTSNNPANCPNGGSLFMSNTTYAGYKTHYAAALTAFSMGIPVEVIISDTSCVDGWPRLIGVYISKNY